METPRNYFDDIKSTNNYTDAYSTNFNKEKSVIHEQDIKYREVVSYFTISSKDRDLSTFPKSNRYNINLDQEYKNVVRIELIQAIIPDKNSVLLEPYILLQIDELDNFIASKDNNISNSFSILHLTPPAVSGSFINVNKAEYENITLEYKTPRASLNKFTIRLCDASGTPFEFGGDSTLDKAYQNLFVFKIVTLEKSRNAIQTRSIYYQ